MTPLPIVAESISVTLRIHAVLKAISNVFFKCNFVSWSMHYFTCTQQRGHMQCHAQTMSRTGSHFSTLSTHEPRAYGG